MNTHDKLYV